MAGCLLKIKEELHHLSESERKVAHYILNNTEEAVHLPIGELALKCHASKTAITRMCQRLNYKGFRDFRIDLASDFASQEQQEHKYTDIKPGDTLNTIIKNVCYNNIKSIDDTQRVLNDKDIEAAISAIHKAKKIVFYGVGASGIVAMDAQQKFLRINRTVFSYPDYHLQAITTATLSEGDVAVVISNSGETKETVDIANIAKDRKAIVISITRFGKNTLSGLSDIKLFLSSPETTIRSGAMGSLIAQLTIVDILFSGVASIEYPAIEEYLDRSREVITPRKYKD
ncbi:RpiR family transcriptional regulator [Scopulibacillus darangshiensis]|uniref:RpiR family transcriptional regulator n=1 Tax=Scopulibacillus darangshiensis TaxID=442528 RepID=A0A4R2P831_9BACL|nr:MurR/RpiR family transcriptional regulator [Scopulibacillus darangshiensis]TCP30977.1 RpiR family transcriptional regulator [Scopulibacillus darangshiensis]